MGHGERGASKHDDRADACSSGFSRFPRVRTPGDVVGSAHGEQVEIGLVLLNTEGKASA